MLLHARFHSVELRSQRTPVVKQCATCRRKTICNVSSANEPDFSDNPLHVLRQTKDVRLRSQLLRALDQKWSEAVSQYQPSEVEEVLERELAVGQQTIMQLALSTPGLASINAADARGTIKALKAANIDIQDIYFLITKRHYLLSVPTTVQRWVDFCSAYGLTPQNIQNLLLRAPEGFLTAVTLFQAGQVVAFLKQLGIRDEYLAQRVLCVWPEVMGRDVEGALRPIVLFLMSLGIEVSDISGIVCVWPELLLCDVQGQLAPFVAYLRHDLGCSALQAAEIIMQCPHLLGFKAADVFGGRVRALTTKLGITPDQVKSMAERSTRWLTSVGGVDKQVDFLLHTARFTREQAAALVVAAPGVLAEKDFELERKWAWMRDVLRGTHEDVLTCPGVMSLGLMQVLGPRHGFLDKAGKLGLLAKQGEGGAPGAPARLDLCRLADPVDDTEWCAVMGVPALEYRRYRAHWEEEYTQGLTRSAAQEFQDELRKLGIYEGTD